MSVDARAAGADDPGASREAGPDSRRAPGEPRFMVGSAVFDRDLRFEAIDDELAAFQGRPVADHPGRLLADLYPGLHALVGDAIRGVLESGEPALGVELAASRAGVHRHARAWFLPRRDATGVVDGVIAVVADLGPFTAADRVSRLGDLAGDLASAVSVHDVCDVLYDRIHDHLGAAACSVFVRDDERGVVHLVRTGGPIGGRARAVEGVPLDGDDPVAVVIRTGRPTSFATRDDLTAQAHVDPAADPGLPAWMAAGVVVPLVSGRAALGAFGLSFDSPREFTAGEMTFLEAVGRLAGPALERARASERERELAALVELADDAMFVRDAAGVIRAWNRGAEVTYGWKADEVIGRRSTDVLATRFPVSESQTLGALRDIGLWEGTLHQRRRDGTAIVVESRWSSLPRMDAEPAILEVSRDVTTRRAIEEEARLNAQRIDAALGILPVMMVTLDRDLRYTWSNRAWGAGPMAIAGLRAADVLPAEAAARHDRIARSVLSAGTTIRDDLEVPGGPEGPRTFQFTMAPLRDASGAVVGVIAAAIDVSDRKRDEEERRRLEAEVREAQRLESLGVLAGGFAHDFNNILAGVIGNTELALIDLPEYAPARASIVDARDSAMRAADLTRQLLALAGKSRVVLSPVDLGDLVVGVGRLLRVAVPDRIAIAYQLGPGVRPIEGDVGQLQQILRSLVENASEALGTHRGTISIRTEAAAWPAARRVPRAVAVPGLPDLPAGPVSCLIVADDGPGMDAATLARVFDPFFSTKFTGRGLGLPAALGVIRSHHGWIDIESEPGRGTTVRLVFPSAAPVAATSDASPPVVGEPVPDP